MKLWKVDHFPVEQDGQQMIVESFTYIGRIDQPASEIVLHEGQALGYFGVDDLDRLKIGFGFEQLFREFFTALAAGTLPLEDNA
jgi:hypothetical protein